MKPKTRSDADRLKTPPSQARASANSYQHCSAEVQVNLRMWPGVPQRHIPIAFSPRWVSASLRYTSWVVVSGSFAMQKFEKDGGLAHSRWRNQCLETNATFKPDDQG